MLSCQSDTFGSLAEATLKQPVIIIGAGMGGLAAAMRLTAARLPVVVLDRMASPGGKMRQVVLDDGAMLDAGPTVFTMDWVFEELFAGLGERMREQLGLSPLTILARHAWRDGSRLDLHADRSAALAAIRSFAGSREAEGFDRFCRDTARMFASLKGPMLTSQRPDMLTLGIRAGLGGLPGLLASRPFSSLWNALRDYFRDPRLLQLFGRYATYTGGSPWLAPAPLMLIAHVEQAGVWSVTGGMHALALAMQATLRRAGATVRLSTHVERIERAKPGSWRIVLDTGETLQSRAVLFNGDASALSAGLLGTDVRSAAPRIDRSDRSLSAQTFLAHTVAHGFPLLRHTVFFSEDYRREFDDVFRERRLPSAPTVYICAQDRPGEDRPGEDRAGEDRAVNSSPAGHALGPERLLMLVNAPADGDLGQPSAAHRDTGRKAMLELLASCGLELELNDHNHCAVGPPEFADLFPGTGGALYGRAPHGWDASFRRPGARTALPGLYLVGGSVHPSAGVPMAALSGRLGADALLEDLARGRLDA